MVNLIFGYISSTARERLIKSRTLHIQSSIEEEKKDLEQSHNLSLLSQVLPSSIGFEEFRIKINKKIK